MTIARFLKTFGQTSYKCGESTPWGSIITGATGLITGGMSAASQSDANASNLQAVRETNELNYKMFHEQQDYTERMWNEANQYNAPARQVERLRQAGINPIAMLGSNGQGSLGTAGIVSSPSTPSLQTAHVEGIDYSPMAQGLARAIDSYYQNQNQDMDAHLKGIELLYQSYDFENRLAKSVTELEQMRSNKKLTDKQKQYYDEQIDSIREDLKVLRAVRSDRVRAYKLQNDETEYHNKLTQAQIRVQESIERINNVEADWIPKQYAANIQSALTNAAANYMSAIASGKSADAAKENAKAALLNALKVDGINMTPQQKNEWIKHKLDLMESETKRNLNESRSWFRRAVDSVEDFDKGMTNGSSGRPRAFGVSSYRRPTDGRNTLRW